MTGTCSFGRKTLGVAVPACQTCRKPRRACDAPANHWCLAAYLSERRAHLDLQINLLAEREVTRVLRLVEKIAQKVQAGPAQPSGELAKDTEVEHLVEELDRRLDSDQ